MIEIIIRKVAKSDYQIIKKLVKELYDTLDEKAGMDEHLSLKKFEEILNEPKTEVLVAEADDKVVGYLTINYNKSLLDVGATAIIDELIVTKAYQKHGVGKQLVNSAIEFATRRGCSEIGVGTEFDNTIARGFYKACGFKEIGVIFEKFLNK